MKLLSEIKNDFFHKLLKQYSDKEIQKLFEYFVEEYLGYDQIQLRFHLTEKINEQIVNLFDNAIQELQKGKPYQHILGKAFFYSEEFLVNENTLIPRPETEELVELAIEKIKHKKNLNILDIGTGSGCIAITLKQYLKDNNISGLDISSKALDIAKLNAKNHQQNVTFFQQDYLNSKLDQVYDVMISNPPYIGYSETEEIEKSVKDFEPLDALFAPENNVLAFYEKIASDIPNYLSSKGFIFLEINQKLGEKTLHLFKEVLEECYLLKDLSGNDRMIWGRK